MPLLIRKADALALFEGSPARLRTVFPEELRGGVLRRLTRQAINDWGEYLPELRAHQLIAARPDAAALIVGPDGLTAADRAAAKRAVDMGERTTAAKPDSHGP